MSSLLTLKEHRIIALVADGLRNSDIAKVIGTTENVVKNYLRTIFDKTGTWTRLELAAGRTSLSRFEAPCHYRTCGIASQRWDDHVNRGTRVEQDAPALLAHQIAG
jgi:DNA-binding CsgD family transcriptional regulator